MKHNKLFLSHSSIDKPIAKRMAMELQQHGLEVWLDEWEVRLGDSLIEKIEKGIATSGYLIAILSNNSISSPWVQKELNVAIAREIVERKVFVLPIKIDDCVVPSFLADKLYADASSDWDRAIQLICERILPSRSDWDYKTDKETDSIVSHNRSTDMVTSNVPLFIFDGEAASYIPKGTLQLSINVTDREVYKIYIYPPAHLCIDLRVPGEFVCMYNSAIFAEYRTSNADTIAIEIFEDDGAGWLEVYLPLKARLAEQVGEIEHVLSMHCTELERLNQIFVT
jgi:TIR domain